MCFAPQRHTLFRHLNFQRWSRAGVLCAFWLGNVLRATTACTFSTSQLLKALRSWGVLYILIEMWFVPQRRALFQLLVRRWCVLYILAWKCASRHNCAQLFISHLTTWLRTRRFSEPTFRPSGVTNHWKNTMDFPTFSRTSSSFFSLFLFSDLLLSDSPHLCFFICPYCRKFDF